MSDSPTISQQYAFSVGEDGDTDGIEPSEESVETDLEAFGANVDHRERDTRIDQPEASSFGVDDRATVTRRDGGEQQALFADTTDDQQTLTGERAASQCLFESDDTESNETADDEDGDDPDAVITASDEASRALADGGHVEDDESGESEGQSDESKDEGNEPNESDNSHEDGDDTASDDDSNDADPTFDPDAETVTDAWQGAYISASWGYNQTNVELAQIIEVSDSGKTVLARFVTAERVGHDRTSEQLRPTADQYGDEFRLHVRDGIKDDPCFRGSYPLSNDGDMDGGPTRRGSFYPWNNDPDNSIRQTATNHGH
ncbi:hypothetical protein [Halococcus thailandensis]|uniref:Uncharacterized protein n=1 Tax=Halococcus thailandensis JCM 13552 TaxID=1227457 RepID=M0NG73_9EURY|nr:hypothetical protein [Halococcus thailandensis]EMA56528.1 hypothetical protein C451_01933 [Halococcus thailandensis JCM 13552]